MRRCGVSPISPVVDVTNYVLLELGQPMHAFDLSKLKGRIVVRFAKLGEQLTLLNYDQVSLTPEILIIADEKDPLAIAGIIGGLKTRVTEETKDVFLESAFFSSSVIIGKAREYCLQTGASYRFERGVDFKLQRKAIEYATHLLLDIVGGDAGYYCRNKKR